MIVPQKLVVGFHIHYHVHCCFAYVINVANVDTDIDSTFMIVDAGGTDFVGGGSISYT